MSGWIDPAPSGQLNELALGNVQGGEVTFEFATCPHNRVWTGSVWVRGVGAATTFEAQVGSVGVGEPRGAWNGSSSFGPVQCRAGQSLTVIGFGISAPAGTVVEARYQGTENPEPVEWAWPLPLAVAADIAPIGSTTYADFDAAWPTYGSVDTAFSEYKDADNYRAVRKL